MPNTPFHLSSKGNEERTKPIEPENDSSKSVQAQKQVETVNSRSDVPPDGVGRTKTKPRVESASCPSQHPPIVTHGPLAPEKGPRKGDSLAQQVPNACGDQNDDAPTVDDWSGRRASTSLHRHVHRVVRYPDGREERIEEAEWYGLLPIGVVLPCCNAQMRGVVLPVPASSSSSSSSSSTGTPASAKTAKEK